MDAQTNPGAARAETLLDLIGGKWSTQAIGVAAQIGLADHLAGAPKSLDALAHATGCDAPSLRRLLRALESLGLCEACDDNAFRMTACGELLRSDSPQSLRSYAVWTAQYQWQTWGRLLDSVRSGESARGAAGGNYGHVRQDPQAAAIFNRAMEEVSALIARPVALATTFASASVMVDVGGGHGELAIAVLTAHPHLHGIIFDLPHAMDGACANISRSGLAGRCEAIAGSFFESIPPGADLHLMKSVLHNWDDAHCGELLARSREALAPGGRLAIVERLLPERVTGAAIEHLVLRGDLNMLVGLGGRERTLVQFEELLGRAGFHLSAHDAMPFGYCLMEARS